MKEIKEKIEDVFKEFPDIKVDEFKFVIDALTELFSRREKEILEEIEHIKRAIEYKKSIETNKDIIFGYEQSISLVEFKLKELKRSSLN